ncbi:MAG: L-2-amino-thiazoline-4-carboxylic acid hydrolase [Calditrichaeota bacterium]|nr:L-2-amino-thiazoline-4-carboxylic acid hydrolase [Calditrichota bacterium]
MQRFIEIFNRESDRIIDAPGQSHLLMCACVLAIYQVLTEKEVDRQTILRELEMAFRKASGNYVKWYVRFMLWISRDKKKFIETSVRRSNRSFGNLFDIVTERTDRQFTSVVKTCGYFDFFQRHQVPELTRIFCAWDALWTEEIHRQNCGIRFNRPTTMAANGQACRFEFYFEGE